MSLHDRIKALKPKVIDPSKRHDKYGIGYAECQRTAGIIAKEADDLMAEMANAIDHLLGMYAIKHCETAMKSDECHGACEVLERYGNWKEQAK